MSAIVISGDTSGSITLNAPDVAGTTVLTLPTESGTLSIGNGSLIGYQIFTASGSYTKATNNPSFVIVEVVGGGGSGRAGINFTNGSAGGYSRKRILNSSLASSETITVGAGGAAVAASANGNAGTSSSFGPHCSATGGAGGTPAAVPGGIGSGGDLNLRGGSAGNSVFGGGGNLSEGGSPNTGAGGGGRESVTSGAGGSGIVIVWEYK